MRLFAGVHPHFGAAVIGAGLPAFYVIRALRSGEA
jgi:hypothetical protein